MKRVHVNNEDGTESRKVFVCSPCSYSSSKLSNFKTHQETVKHIRNSEFVRRSIPNDPSYTYETDSGSADIVMDFDDNITDQNVDSSPLTDHTDDQEEIQQQQDTDSDPGTSSWSPFSSKVEMLLYILIHSKTHIVSDETAKFIWFIMKECGLDVPPFIRVKNLSFGGMNADSFVEKSEDKDGVPFYLIKPSSLLQLEMANPNTANNIIRYPTSMTQARSYCEQSDGKKFQSLEWEWASSIEGEEFFKGDFVMHRNSRKIGKIMSFFENIEKDIIYAAVDIYDKLGDSHTSLKRSGQKGSVQLKYMETVCMDKYELYAIDEDNNHQLLTAQEKETLIKSSRDVKMPIVNVPINLFFDDTSANLSKKWKPLHCIQLQMAGLPVSSRQQQKNVKFVTASSNVNMMQLLQPVIEDIKEMKRNGVVTYDAKLKREVLLKTDVACCVCDFNMLAEAANHMGPNTKKFCPRCYADKSTCIEQGQERESDKTRKLLNRLQLHYSKDLSQRHGIKFYENCLWEIIDPHSDIPVGQLHWMYLGLGKFILKKSFEISDNLKEKLVCIIDAMDQSSFKSKISSEIVTYIDSRQGKDIKNYLQIAPFHFAILGLPVERVKIVSKLAELSKIFSMGTSFGEDYLEIVEVKIHRLLKDIKNVYPVLLGKVKTHLSTHIVDDIKNHGPPSAYIEDQFEKNHGRIRSQLFIQNQHAISRDSACAFAEMEIMNHILTGGFFQEGNKWVQASLNVQELFIEGKVLKFLGGVIDVEEDINENQLRKAERNKSFKPIRTAFNDDDELQAIQSSLPDLPNLHNCHRILYKSVVTRETREMANANSPVLFINSNGEEQVGLFMYALKVVTSLGQQTELVKIQKLEKDTNGVSLVGVSCEVVCACPGFVYVPSVSVLQTICLVHACDKCSCRMKDSVVDVRVEQELKQVRKKVWAHSNQLIFYMNRFSFVHKKQKYFA